jgi:hypothetical protein
MFRHAPAFLAALSLSTGSAEAQTSNATTPAPSLSGSDSANVEECAGVGLGGAHIVVGHIWARRLELDIDGGDTCGGFSSPFIVDVFLYHRQGEPRDFINRRANCPAFNAQADKLRPHRKWDAETDRPDAAPVVTARAGAFTITDFAGFFQLGTAVGRRAAARWITQTLVAVRECWIVAEDPSSPPIVSGLYRELGMEPPLAFCDQEPVDLCPTPVLP